MERPPKTEYLRLTLTVVVFSGLLSAQTFEVASVKPAPPPGPTGASRQIHGGPGGPDPGTITYTNMDLLGLVTMAYEVHAYQVVGPDWLNSTRFDITAKLPPATTLPQFRVMLQNLLADRFRLAIHRDQKQFQGFDLTVAKGGPKLTKSTESSVSTAGDGSPQPPMSPPQAPRGYTGVIALRLARSSMEHFAAFLSGVLGQPVHDATGLTDTYDIQVRYSLAGLQPEVAPGDDGMPTPLEALQQQLGLKLVPRKETIGIVVIDRIEKVPTEN